MKTITSLLLFTMFFTSANSQKAPFNSQGNWSANKKELVFGVGATQFLGDLGGATTVGKDYSLKDMNFASTGWNAMVGFRFRFHRFFATTTSLNVGMLRGDDALTKNEFRNKRNLNFRTINFELSQRLEFIVFANEKRGSRYTISTVSNSRQKDKNQQLYIFGGIGINYFNPKGKNSKGDWVALRPLNTEGQTLSGGPKKSLPITAVIPVGLGFRFGLTKMWRMGIEATYVKTFSDYIDDVSTEYYDPAALASNFGQESVDMANKTKGKIPGFGAAGDKRGDDKQKDAYFYVSVYFMRNLTHKNYTDKDSRWRGRYKF